MTVVFQWFRNLVSPIHEKVEELIHCPYCTGHYVSLIFLLIMSFVNKDIFVSVSPWFIFNFLFTWFCVMGITGVIHYVLLRSYDPVSKASALRKLEKYNKNKGNDITRQ